MSFDPDPPLPGRRYGGKPSRAVAPASGPATGGPAAASRVASGGRGRAMSVSELSDRIGRLLEEGIGHVRVEGEISNFTVSGQGHAYFALKDAESQIACVCFRSRLISLPIEPRDGARVEVSGRVGAYRRRTEVQILVDTIRIAGEGELMRRFLELRDRLRAEGLFDPARKRTLPGLPRVVGVVTSPSGAAVRDVLNVIRRRARGVLVLVSPCQVQGDGAAASIVRAIRRLERDGRAEAILVARGGGSIEDLWAFNEEPVARAIAGCSIPVISGVGHETDTTLADFAADARAPTPSAAAEIVTARFENVAQRVAILDRALDRDIFRRVAETKSRLETLENSWGMRRPMDRLRSAMQRADELVQRLDRTPARLLRAAGERLRDLAARLERASPVARTARARALLERATARLDAARPDVRARARLAADRARLEQLSHRLAQAMRSRAREERMRVDALAARLHASGPDATLARGYSIVTARGRLVTAPDQARAGTTVRVRSAGGEWKAIVARPGDDLFEG